MKTMQAIGIAVANSVAGAVAGAVANKLLNVPSDPVAKGIETDHSWTMAMIGGVVGLLITAVLLRVKS